MILFSIMYTGYVISATASMQDHIVGVGLVFLYLFLASYVLPRKRISVVVGGFAFIYAALALTPLAEIMVNEEVMDTYVMYYGYMGTGFMFALIAASIPFVWVLLNRMVSAIGWKKGSFILALSAVSARARPLLSQH